MTDEHAENKECASGQLQQTSLTKKVSKARIALTAGLVAVSTFVVALVLSVLITPYSWETPSTSDSIRDYSVLFEPDETLDVLFFGDSEAYSSLSPLGMYGEAGFTSYTCAVGSQLISRSQVVMNSVLAHQTPKVVVIETNQLFSPVSSVDALKAEVSKVFPFVEYHDRWKTLLNWGGDRTYGKKWGKSYKGFRTSVETNAASDDAIAKHETDTTDVAPVGDLNKHYLELMVEACQSRGISVILLSTPSTWSWTKARHNAVEQIAYELGVTYVDLNWGDTKLDINWQTETRDKGDHVNYLGSKKVSSYIASYLKDTYNLPDHRGDSAYAKWDSDYQSYVDDYAAILSRQANEKKHSDESHENS